MFGLFFITTTTYFQTHFCHPLTQSLYFPPFVLVYELKITTFLLCFFVYLILSQFPSKIDLDVLI
jgi:hypothetical protein